MIRSIALLFSGLFFAFCMSPTKHAVGSEFNFMGRPFMYGVGALGNEGGEHTINMFKTHLYQIMQQLTIENVDQFKDRLIEA